MVGQLETEAVMQAREVGRKTRQAIRDANKRLEQERDRDWSELDAVKLEQKLIQHRVVKRQSNGLRDRVGVLVGTEAMEAIARKLVLSQEESVVDDDDDNVGARNDDNVAKIGVTPSRMNSTSNLKESSKDGGTETHGKRDAAADGQADDDDDDVDIVDEY